MKNICRNVWLSLIIFDLEVNFDENFVWQGMNFAEFYKKRSRIMSYSLQFFLKKNVIFEYLYDLLRT